MKAPLCVLCALVVLLITIKTPHVLAQTTTISNVSYTKTALFDIDTQTPNPPLIVNATIGYAGAKSGDYLIVGIFNLDDGNLVKGLGSSTPLSCESTAQYAGCLVPLSNGRGSEWMQFSLEHPQQVWNLALIAALLDNATHPIPNSFSDYTFTITVESALTLTINVPASVPIKVDGLNGSGGSLQVALAAGNHTVSVPQLVLVNNMTRLRFIEWSDGSTATNRTVELNHDVTLDANYVTQYYLSVKSPVNVTGAGWYDAGTGVTLSVPSTTAPMEGILGVVGARWVLMGWFEGPTEISQSSAQSFTLTSPLTIEIRWTPDYTLPLVILGLAMLVSGSAFYFKRIKARTKSFRARRSSRPRRARSVRRLGRRR